MAYNEHLANRVREALIEQPLEVDEKHMFQGVCFMVDDKMCICVRDNALLCRIGKDQVPIELEQGESQQMMNGQRVMKDFVWVDGDSIGTHSKFNHWIELALAFNKVAVRSKSRKTKDGKSKDAKTMDKGRKEDGR